MLPDELRGALACPVISLPSYFHRDGRPDLESLRTTVDFCLDNDFHTLLLTSGDSNYELQSEQEIRDVARTVIDQAGDRAAVVVGTAYQWWRDQIVDQYDNPFFEHAIGHAKGFHPVRQACFEVFGRGPRWLRAPQPSLDDGEMEELRNVFTRMGLL